MVDWLNTPLIIIAVLGVLKIIANTNRLMATVDAERVAVDRRFTAIAKRADEDRASLMALMQEIRADIKRSVARSDDRFVQMDAKWDDRFTQMDARSDDRINRLEAKWDERFGRMDARLARVEQSQARVEGRLEGLSEAVAGRAAG